jgi:hypothetical protein
VIPDPHPCFIKIKTGKRYNLGMLKNPSLLRTLNMKDPAGGAFSHPKSSSKHGSS